MPDKIKTEKEKTLYILTDVYKDTVIMFTYSDLQCAKDDMKAEFTCFTSDDNSIEYGKDCLEAENGLSAWARLDGKYRIWNITKVN